MTLGESMTIQDLDTHPKKFVRPSEFAEYLDRNIRTVYIWIEKGALEVIHLETGTVMIPIEEARRFARGEKRVLPPVRPGPAPSAV